MKTLNFESYEMLIKVFNLKVDDYETWSALLKDYDEDLLDHAIKIYCKTQNKAPKIADIVKIVEELMQDRKEQETKPETEEEKQEAKRKIYEEAIKAKNKNYVLLYEQIPNGQWKYSWVHKCQLLTTKNIEPFDRHYDGNKYTVYILKK